MTPVVMNGQSVMSMLKYGHLPERDRGQSEAERDQEARIDLLHQPADDHHRDHRAEAARRQHQADR